MAQWGDLTHPLLVTLIFIVVQNLEGLFYAPRIVGNSVGLHPMTVIVSIFVWGYYWWIARSHSSSAADSHDQSVVGKVCVGRASAQRNDGGNRGGSGRGRSRG